MEKQQGFCEFCKQEKEQIVGVTFGKAICEDCSKDLYSTNEQPTKNTRTSLEEIEQLVKRMKEAIDTLEGTGLEYFSKEQLVELNQLSNQLAEISFLYLFSLEDSN